MQVDKLIQTVAIGLGLSNSGWVWNNMHNKHHAAPNKVSCTMSHLNARPSTNSVGILRWLGSAVPTTILSGVNAC